MPIIDLKDCTIKIIDGTPSTPNTITVKIGEGNLTYNEKKNIEYMKDRGELDTVREGDEEPVELSFDFQWREIQASSGSGVPSVEDALKKRGEAADWVSTDSDACTPYAVDIELEHTPSCDTEDIETILFPDFRYESLNHDSKAGTVACSGKCNAVEPSVSRTAQ